MKPAFALLLSLTRLRLDTDEAEALAITLAEFKDWPELLELCELYGLSSIVNRLVSTYGLVVPSEFLLPLKALQIRHQAIANVRYSVISEVVESFAQAQLPMIALKGLALAPMVYPGTEYRPMRDVDILVPKDRLNDAAKILRQLGFELPEEQPSKFMRGVHQLPNATKTQDGFTISIEIHHDAFNADYPDSLPYDKVKDSLQSLAWQDLEFQVLNHELMLHQVAGHLEGVHPGGVLKMINVLDVVEYSESFIDEIDWELLNSQYSHVINTLKCLQLIVPFSDELRRRIGDKSQAEIQGVGEISPSLTITLKGSGPLYERLGRLFNPSDWWLYLYYNREPGASLTVVKFIRHPATIAKWLTMRLYSALRGG